MLAIVKLALRISSTSTTFDDEIKLYIADCLAELAGLGVTNISETTAGTTTYDDQVQSAVIAYCKWKFGNNEDKAQWEAIYHQKLAQLKTMTGHTDWSETNG